ncbi:hypothetical protein GCM10018785_17870 [Streptomyces longispororuber]|uniref:Uncharacterized protein n=2 Tax=Streptomyces longispororuber TaxID=68230 RepID=A0A919DJQ5_9ACTN|nr:hypothetical protein GCM10018785_17870 [Streptomyces longispororuber]
MNSGTYARLYGPARPAPRSEHKGLVVVAGVLWALTLVSLGWITLLVGLAALWGAAAGEDTGAFVLRYVAVVAGAAATLTALTFAPGIRRLSWPSRLLLTGIVACPITTGLALWSWAAVG